MNHLNRADWLEDQSRLHFNKLGSLAAKTVNAQTMGQIVAHADLEKEAGVGTFLANLGGKARKFTQSVGRGARQAFSGPQPSMAAAGGARGAVTAPLRAQPMGGARGAVTAPPRAMPQTQPPARVVPKTQYSGGVDPYAQTMAPTSTVPRTMPAVSPGQVAPAGNRAQTIAASPAARARAATPPPTQAPQAPLQPVDAPGFYRGKPIIEKGGPLPAPDLPASAAQKAQYMQGLEAAGVNPEQARILQQAYGGQTMQSARQTKNLGQIQNPTLRTNLEGYGRGPGGQMIPLYMPKLSEHKLNMLVKDFIDRGMPRNGDIVKTASEMATLDDNGILKVASSDNYWLSPRGVLHLTFLGGVYDENPELAWDMAKNAGIGKAVGWLAGKAVGAGSKAVGGIARGGQAVGRGFQTAGRGIQRGGQALTGGAQRGRQAASGWWNKGGKNPFQRGAQGVSDWYKGQGKHTLNVFGTPVSGVSAPRRAMWKATEPVLTGAAATVKAGRGFAQSVRQGYQRARSGASYSTQTKMPGAKASLTGPEMKAPGNLQGRNTGATQTWDVPQAPPPASTPVGPGPHRSAPAPQGPPPRVDANAAPPPRVDPGQVVPNAPTQKPGAVKSTTEAAGTAADAASSGRGEAPTEPTTTPGFWDRSAGKTLRHMGLAGAIGVPVLGYSGLSAAQSFIDRQPPLSTPYQYGMGTPQDWNRSWQM